MLNATLHQGLTRRNFLKASTAATGSVVLGSSLAACAPKSNLADTSSNEAESSSEIPATLSGGQPQNDGEQIFHCVCRPGCQSFCRLNVHVRDGYVVKTSRAEIAGNPEYSRVCLRGLSQATHLYNDKRVKYPMRRVEGTERGAGEWERISWDEAIAEMAAKIEEIQGKYGPQAVASFQGGNGGTLMQTMRDRLWNLLGFSFIDICADAPLDYGGVFLTGGFDECNEIKDCLNAKTIAVWGCNISHTYPHYWHFLNEAQQAGTKIVVVDPNFTHAASLADLWVPVRPGADAALCMGVMSIIREKEAIDADFMTRATVSPFLVRADTSAFLRGSEVGIEPIAGEEGMDPYDAPMVLVDGAPVTVDEAESPQLEGECEVNGVKCRTVYSLLMDELDKYTPARAAEIADITEEMLYELADLFIDGPVTHILGYGQTPYHNGFKAIQAGVTMCAMTGNWGKPGASYGISFPFFEGLNSDYHYPTENVNVTFALGDLPQVAKSGKLAGEDFPVKMLWNMAANPLGGAYNTNALLNEAWPALEYIVVIDTHMTDTACYADLVLPGAQHLEIEDMTTMGSTFNMSHSEKAVEPPFEAKSDADIIRLLAQQLGLGDYFTESDEEVLRAHIDTEANAADGWSFDILCEKQDMRITKEDTHIFAPNGEGFWTPSGRMEFYQEAPYQHIQTDGGLPDDTVKEMRLPGWFPPMEAWHENDMTEKYPLQAMMLKSRFHAHSQFFDTPTLLELEPEPVVLVNPRDAADRGIEDGMYVECFNDRGHAVAKTRYSEGLRPGVIAYHKGWTRSQHIAGGFSELLPDYLEPYTVNTSYNDVLCDVRVWNDGEGDN